MPFPRGKQRLCPMFWDWKEQFPVSRRKSHKIPVGSGKFCHVGSQTATFGPPTATAAWGQRHKHFSFFPTLWDHRPTPRVPIKPRRTPVVSGNALPVLCGVLVLRHHLWHVDGRVRWPWHGEGRLLPLLLQRVRGRGSPMGSRWHGRGRRWRQWQGRAGVRRGHRRGGRR